MTSSRRDFLQISATAASAFALQPLSARATGLDASRLDARNPAVASLEQTLLRAHPVPLGRVRITGGPAKQAQDLDVRYLLSLDPDRMMAYYRMRAGLAPKAQPYAGWDGDGHNLTGHIAGHYLSAVSLMLQATGDARFKQRADHIVAEMKAVQDKHGDGYLCALVNGREAFGEVSKGEIRSKAFDLNGMWSPWYTLHKTFAGLRDAYRHAGNETALDVEAQFAAWTEGVIAPLSDEQVQDMLNTEHGGILEIFADLYADTGDRRWLALSRRFEHHAFTDALKRGEDNLNGKHGNCQIPKLVGAAARYGYTADAGDLMGASFFWDTVVRHHTFASGGHGREEYFGPPDALAAIVDGRTCESCNVYNMLKLTRRLFSFHPDPYLADFQERATFNHVLASIDPKDGRMSYMVPVGRDEQQEYQDMQESFTCCVGTGMENHALYGDGLYYEAAEGPASPEGDRIWVNLFIPSTADFTVGGVKLAMDTTFPDGDDATIRLSMPEARKFTLAIRRPHWAGDGFKVAVNGQDLPQPPLASLAPGAAGGRPVPVRSGMPPASTYVEIARTWSNGDTVTLVLPKSLSLQPTLDDATVTAINWGPLALAGDLGPRRERREERTGTPAPVPMLVAAGRPLTDWLAPAQTPGNFVARDVSRVADDPASAPKDWELAPFYRTFERRYSLYFDVVTSEEFERRAAARAAERANREKLEAVTVSFVEPGRRESERDRHYQSDPADRRPERVQGRSARSGPGWFSYDLAVDPSAPMTLVVTYYNPDGQPPAAGDFQIIVDGSSVGRFAPRADAAGFWDAQYPIPTALSAGKSTVTVRFEASVNGRIVPVFGVRMIKGSPGGQ